MIITTDSQKNTYSSYHIAKAFFPNEEIETQIKEDGEDPRSLYLRLRKETGRDLPWGMLTGVRPTKLAMEKVKEQMPLEEFEKWFYENRFVSKEKADLAYEIAAKEEKLIKRTGIIGEDSFSLYVNIPFCPTICTYCSFPSGAIADYADVMEEYLTCLFSELAAVSVICEKKKLTSIYIGGGTPTTLTPQQLERLLSEIRNHFHTDGVEFTLEAGRPDTITREKLLIAKESGISRISINPQSMQQKTLDVIGRRHSPQQIEEAYALAREEGFDNINMDLIMGLPGEDLKDVEDTLIKIRKMRPDSLTVHSLSIKRTSQIFSQTTDAQTVEQMLERAVAFARSEGMEPYYLYRQKGIAGNFENTGWALPGKECLYNILIMEEIQSILAVGAGASTKRLQLEGGLQIKRSHNVSNIKEYLTRIDEMIRRKQELFS
ncbi:MAG: coproporphyrinogen dehydrogenase HemZ [Parasporobacterium sp.]|nr:coproporphyrinogen dehydrogenase HemZ [Lachnospiraceae bacterium]MBR3400730.1 coproporphyrinogen dehydrogenase HemZ [Parasporobacterium sp.]MBR3644324.1 coproporphyrinogen dehydrogenase HemZ [Parasporobacterium sp.]